MKIMLILASIVLGAASGNAEERPRNSFTWSGESCAGVQSLATAWAGKCKYRKFKVKDKFYVPRELYRYSCKFNNSYPNPTSASGVCYQ
jgi:hypothetical protein